MVHFSHKVSAIPVILAALFVAGCYDHTYDYSDYEDHDSRRAIAYHDSSDIFTALSGNFSLEKPLVPKTLTITALDQKLDEFDIYEASIHKDDSGRYTFTSDSSFYPTTFAKLTFTCTRSDSPDAKELTFEEYVDFGRYPSPSINLLGALESKRVRYLVQEDGFYLNNAKKKASREIFRMFGMEWQEGTDFEADSVKFEALKIMPYILASTGDSDASFAATFETIASTIEQNKVNESLFDTLHIADALLARDWNFSKIDSTSLSYFSTLWQDTYGLPACDSIGLQAQINQDGSAQDKNYLVCDVRSDSIRFWKKFNALDTEFGPCHSGNTNRYVKNDTVYTCSESILAWVPANDKDAIEYLFGECGYGNKGKYRAYHDHIFTCDGYGFSMRWTDTISGFNREQAEFEAYFYNMYGDCTADKENEKAAYDSSYFKCHNGKWESITVLGYVTDDTCTAGDTLKLPPSSYFRCDANNNWNGISYFDYYGIACGKENENEVAYADSVYYWCVFRNDWQWRWERLPADKQIPPILNQDTCRNGHVVKYDSYYICKNGEWETLPDNEAILPVIHEDGCGELEDSTYITYDGEYYFCENSKWSHVQKSQVIAPVLAGDSCTTENKAEIRKYDDKYFICISGYNQWGQLVKSHWSTAQPEQIAVYERNANRIGYCKAGQTGTTLEWDESVHALFGCVKSVDGTSYEWARIVIGDMEPSEQKNFANGTFEKEGVYECDVSGNHYEFEHFFWNDKTWKDYVRLRLERATIDGTGYDARMVNGKMYIRAPYGSKSIYLNDYENRSESFDSFDQKWSRWAGVKDICGDSTECKGSIKFVHNDENTFTMWESAKTYCPAGFHIPDTTEWKSSGINEWKRTIDSDEMNRITNVVEGIDEVDKNGSFERVLVLLWSSTEKDADTQYCFTYEISSFIFNTNKKAMIECPKDLMPMGQAMCVRD